MTSVRPFQRFLASSRHCSMSKASLASKANGEAFYRGNIDSRGAFLLNQQIIRSIMVCINLMTATIASNNFVPTTIHVRA